LSFLDRARERLFGSIDGKPVSITDPREQTEEDKALVSFVKNKLEEVRQSSARVAQEGINLTNIAYLCGFDAIYFDGVSRAFKPIPSPSTFIKRNKVHVNRILPTVQNRLARLLKNEPRWDVRPKSGDEEDKDGARLAQQVILQLWGQLGINRKRIPLTMWLQQCGSAYLKVSWDPSLGRKKVYPVKNEETGEDEYKIVAEGDIRVDVKSYFNIFPDPLAKSWDELRYLIDATVRPIEYFASQFPESNGNLVKEEDVWLNSLAYESRINSINTTSGTAGSSATQLKNSAIEISYMEVPSNKHPYGRHVIVANGVKLKDDILPIDEISYIKFDDVIVGGKFNAEAIITHLRPLQDHLNKNKTMRAAFMNRLLTGKVIGARGQNVAAEAFNDQSGEWIKYDVMPGAPEPHAMQMPTIPQYAYEEERISKDDINDTAGINEASRGQLPSSSIPAIGMQLLVEQDDTRIGVETEGHEYSYADLGRILLKFVDKFYESDRLLKIVGENMEYTVKTFKGSDLRENFDVQVIRGSTLPGSKVLKRQEIINLHQQGYFGDPKDPNVTQNVLSMLEFGDEFQAWKKHSLRMAQIQRGLEMVESGIKPPVSEFDDHALWLQQFDEYRIGEKYLKLSPDQQMIVIEVMEEHTNWIKELSGLGAPDPSQDPHLQPTDAAEQAEAQAKQAVMASGAQNMAQGQPGQAPPPNSMPQPGAQGPMPQPQITPPPGASMPAPPH
jgi:hypothetical protein